jgi:hypothetical protein
MPWMRFVQFDLHTIKFAINQGEKSQPVVNISEEAHARNQNKLRKIPIFDR